MSFCAASVSSVLSGYFSFMVFKPLFMEARVTSVICFMSALCTMICMSVLLFAVSGLMVLSIILIQVKRVFLLQSLAVLLELFIFHQCLFAGDRA